MLVRHRIHYTVSPAEGRNPLQKTAALSKTLKYIWLWGSSFGALRIVEYPFIAITLKSTLTQSGSIF